MITLLQDFEGKVQTREPDWKGVPMTFWGKVSAVCRSMADCNNLVQWFDDQPNFCPYQPILVMLPDGEIKQVAGLGFATAAELRDCCCEVWGIYTSADGAKRFNVDDMREQAGMVPRDRLTEAVSYAFWERRERHRASPVTDPWKQFIYPNYTNKVQFGQMPDNKGWKA